MQKAVTELNAGLAVAEVAQPEISPVVAIVEASEPIAEKLVTGDKADRQVLFGLLFSRTNGKARVLGIRAKRFDSKPDVKR